MPRIVVYAYDTVALRLSEGSLRTPVEGHDFAEWRLVVTDIPNTHADEVEFQFADRPEGGGPENARPLAVLGYHKQQELLSAGTVWRTHCCAAARSRFVVLLMRAANRPASLDRRNTRTASSGIRLVSHAL